MKKIAAPFFLLVFLTFIAVPSVVVLIDESVDISFAFTANEEENSKHHVELHLALSQSCNYESILFLQEQNLIDHYSTNKHLVYLEVLSPPPKRIA